MKPTGPPFYSGPVQLATRSARLTVWFNAWRCGHVALDTAPGEVIGDDAGHDVTGLDPEPLPLLLAFGRLRTVGADLATLALPMPGDLSGLAGPPRLNEAAIEAGEAVVFGSAGLALVPTLVGRGVFWHAHEARPARMDHSLGDAERLLREALVVAADRLTDLDLARWRPEVSETLALVREPTEPLLPPGYSPRAGRMAALAERCRLLVDTELDDEASHLDQARADERRRLLLDLERSARQAMVTACTHGTSSIAQA